MAQGRVPFPIRLQKKNYLELNFYSNIVYL